MKHLFGAIALMISVTTFAADNYRAEFDETQELKCHEELKARGCVQNGEEKMSCAEAKKKQLSKDCQKIHEARKLNS